MLKPIQGTWLEIQHHNKAEGVYWDSACARFSCRQWELKIEEMAEIGLEYFVLLSVACFGQTFYHSSLYPKFNLSCEDPIKAILRAADHVGGKVFLSNGFFTPSDDFGQLPTDSAATGRRLAGMKEIAERYGHHKSVYGWYFPREAYIRPYFSDEYLKYVNDASAEARRLLPEGKILIAPYGTRLASPDERFVQQLDELDVDIVAYQDEVGVRKSSVAETGRFYEALRKAHDRVPRVALWADVEVFDFEGEVYQSALIPASFSRVKKQMEAVSPFVDRILIYQYQGLMNRPGSAAFAGHAESTRLYSDYAAWLKKHSSASA